MNYKFRDLKVYGSTEWLADNKKKYRQVFDRYEVSYVYAELSIYNKLFDESDWNIKVNFKCFALKKGKKELCDLTFERNVSKYDQVFYVREGWGNNNFGSFWKKGTYCWEVYIEGEKVAEKYFYIEETDAKFPDVRSYIYLQSVKMYEGPFDYTAKDDRIYYRIFGKEETRYIFLEIIFDNLLRVKNWYCELTVNFLNSARQVKGQITKLQNVDPDDEYIEFDMNWGSNIKGSWSPGSYTAEIIFMDTLFAIIPFEVQYYFEEGTVGIIYPEQFEPVFNEPVEESENFDQVMLSLDELIGLNSIKQQFRNHASYLKFLNLRRDKGYVEEENLSIHAVFTGNPGTGKTTVAKMMGKLYRSMGILTKGHVHEVDRVDLVGEYIGQTAPKVREAIEQARGGVLFIDEAYSLSRNNDDTKDFGREVVEILVREMSNGPGDLAVIVAGYPKEMKYFLDSNPGLRSRFKLFFEFPDYLPDELSLIADYVCNKKSVILSEESRKLTDELITEAYRKRDKSFGNARFVYDLIEQAKVNLGLRIMSNENPAKFSKEELGIVIKDDVDNIDVLKPKRLPDLPIDEKLLKLAMGELNSMIGMQNIKVQLEELVKLVRFYRESKRNVLNKFFLHTVFVGNPGTGKTTVARILAKIYKALGILERGHTVETDRQGLVAGYVGQTAIKTSEKIDEAMGGVLFIDEAYALSNSLAGNVSSGDFGNEAIQTILKRMEDLRGQFFVFVAGYPDNMEGFLKANPGLRSRFDKILKFEDYSAAELMEIALGMIGQEELKLAEDARIYLQNYLEYIHNFRDKYFGNARSVRNIVNEITKNQSLRLSAIASEDRDPSMLNVLTYEDVATLKMSNDDDIFNKKSIGFKKSSGAGTNNL